MCTWRLYRVFFILNRQWLAQAFWCMWRSTGYMLRQGDASQWYSPVIMGWWWSFHGAYTSTSSTTMTLFSSQSQRVCLPAIKYPGFESNPVFDHILNIVFTWNTKNSAPSFPSIHHHNSIWVSYHLHAGLSWSFTIFTTLSLCSETRIRCLDSSVSWGGKSRLLRINLI